ncbi:MAG: hypothetical protein ACXVA0_23825 [Mucilaginibacter sp.]
MASVFIIFSLTGCQFNIGMFIDQVNKSPLYKETKLDHELSIQLLSTGCPKIPPKSKYDEMDIESFKSSRIKIFNKQFPEGIPIAAMLTDLKASDANCHTQREQDFNVANCILKKEYVVGTKVLGLTGWKVTSAGLLKNSFEYRFTHQGNAISNLTVNIIECDGYPIDPILFQNSKTIKPIRSMK